ncbi:MAG: hypothetical protein LUG27_06090 [Clostridiales bacterium]|nr:hypothetical protein [Clostridiales bacterium]
MDLKDGAVRIFLNTHGKDDEGISPELKELLYFIEHTNDPGMVFQSEKVNSIRKSVRSIQDNEEVGLRYMQEWEEKLMYQRMARQEGLEEGRKEGREEGRKEMQSVIDEAKHKLNKAHEREIQTFLNLLESGMSQEEAQGITNSGDDIVREALQRFPVG